MDMAKYHELQAKLIGGDKSAATELKKMLQDEAAAQEAKATEAVKKAKAAEAKAKKDSEAK